MERSQVPKRNAYGIKFKAAKVEVGKSYTKCAGYEQSEIYSDDVFDLPFL